MGDKESYENKFYLSPFFPIAATPRISQPVVVQTGSSTTELTIDSWLHGAEGHQSCTLHRDQWGSNSASCSDAEMPGKEKKVKENHLQEQKTLQFI